MPISTNISTQGVIDQVKQLGAAGEDLSAIKDSINAIEAKEKAAIKASLEGVVDLAARGKKPGKAFVLAAWRDGKMQTFHGVDYGYQESIPEDQVGRRSRVFVYGEGYGYGVRTENYTMARFCKSLDESGMIHVVRYID